MNDAEGHATNDSLAEQISTLLKGNTAARVAAAKTLGASGDLRAVEPLIACLNAWDKSVCTAAIEALGQLGELAVAPLITQLGKSLKRQVLRELFLRIGTPAVVSLIAALQHEDPDIRIEAAEILGQLRDRQAIEPLIRSLDDENSSVRLTAAIALSNWGALRYITALEDVAVVEPFIKRLDDENSSVRQTAAEVLGDFGDSRAMIPLLTLLGDPKGKVREAAIRAISRFGTQAIAPLVELAGDAMHRGAAIHTLLWIAEPAIDPRQGIWSALNREQREAIPQAVKELAKLVATMPDAIEPLMALLNDDRNQQRCKLAIGILLQIREVAIAPLVAVLRTGESRQREKAARCLSALGWIPTSTQEGVTFWSVRQDWDACAHMGSLGIEPLLTAFDEKTESSQDCAHLIRVLGKLGDRRAFDRILTALQHTDTRIRVAAAEVLGRLRATEAVAGLIVALHADDQRLRLAAARALGQIGIESKGPLLEALNNKRPQVRRAAAIALGSLGDKTTLKPLMARLHDEESSVVEAAAYALGKLGDGEAVQPLLEILAQERPSAWQIEELLMPPFPELYEHANEDPRLAQHNPQSVAAWALGQLGDRRAVEPLIAMLHSTASDYLRLAALYALGVLGGDRVCAALITVLQDSDLAIVTAAAQALGRLGDRRAVPALIAAFENWPQHRGMTLLTRSNCYEAFLTALGELGDRRAVEPLIRALLSNLLEQRPSGLAYRVQLPYSRGSVARVLGQLGNRRAVEPLMRLLRSYEASGDRATELRLTAVNALAELRDPRAVQPLAEILHNTDSDRTLTVAIIWALAAIGGPQSADHLFDSLERWQRESTVPEGWAVTQAFVRATGQVFTYERKERFAADQQAIQQEAALALVTKFGDPRALPLLMDVVEHPDSDLRCRAASALGKCCDPQVLAPLRGRLRDWHPKVRGVAARALGDLGERRAVESLRETLDDDDWQVREAAAQALNALGWQPRDRAERATYWIACREWDSVAKLGATALERLTRRMRDMSVMIRRASVRTLGQIKAPESVTALVRALSDPNPDVRAEAARGLAKQDADQAVYPLVERLQEDTNNTVLAALIHALGDLRADSAAGSIAAFLTDSAPNVRAAAAEVLGELTDDNTAEKLMAALDDDALEVRLSAIRSLGKRRHVAAIDSLLQYLDDPSTDISTVVAQALCRIGDARAVEPLAQKLQREDGPTRADMLEALKVLVSERTLGAFTWHLTMTNPPQNVSKQLEDIISRYAGISSVDLQQSLEDQLAYVIDCSAARAIERGDLHEALVCYIETVRYYSNKVDQLTGNERGDGMQRAARFCFEVGLDGVRRFVTVGELQYAGSVALALIGFVESLNNDSDAWRRLKDVCDVLAHGGDDIVTLSIYRRAIALIESGWALQPVEEAGLRHFFVDKAELYDGLALCYLRLGASTQAWETLEAAKTRYLGDLIVRRHSPPMQIYRPEVKTIWQLVRRAQTEAMGPDADAPPGTLELIGIKPSDEADVGAIAVGYHRQAFKDYLDAHERNSMALAMIEDLWDIPSQTVNHPLAHKVPDAFRLLRQYVDKMLRQQRETPGVPPGEEQRELLQRSQERLDALQFDPDGSDLHLPYGTLADYYPTLSNWLWDVPPEQALLELEALLEALNVIVGEGKVFVHMHPRAPNDPPANVEFITTTPQAPRANSARQRVHEAVQKLANAWSQVEQIQWRYIKQLARGRPSPSVALHTAVVRQPRSAIIAFQVTRDGTVAYLARSSRTQGRQSLVPVWPDQSAIRVLTRPKLTLDRLQSLLQKGWIEPHSKLGEVGMDCEDADAAKAQLDCTLGEIYETLLRPIDNVLRAWGVERVTFIPHRGLHVLPLHACWHERNGKRRYFIDDYEVRYAPSSTLLEICRERTATSLSKSPTLLAIADPKEVLEYASGEVDLIARFFPSGAVTKLVTSEARIDQRTLPISATHIHFSCHGSYERSDPLQTRLQLAGNDRISLGDLFDERLQLSEVALVILSACETGLVDQDDLADEYLGLASGFLFAGAPAVVSTLWSVRDLSTMLLIEQFYKHHLNEQLKSPAAALRVAQLWLRTVTAGDLAERFAQELKASDSDRLLSYAQASDAWQQFTYNFEEEECPYAHPAYWAAFMYTGL